MACKAVAQKLAFTEIRQVSYHGKTYGQWVAEAEVTLTGPAKPSRKTGKKPAVPGAPVAARLVVSMACVTVRTIAADKSLEAAELRLFLIKLSGRQRRGV